MANSRNLAIDPLQRTLGLRALATEQLMHAIFTRKIVAGDRLIVAKVAQQLGVSASPVREALVELASVDLVDLLPNRGAVCLPFGPRQLREIFHVRCLLEAEATRLACRRIPPESLGDLRLQSQSLAESNRASSAWLVRVTEVDIALHQSIVDYCENSRLRHEIDRYGAMMRSIRIAAGNRRDIQIRAIEDHLKIIDALLDGQPDMAAKCMAAHLEGTAQRLVEVMFPSIEEAG